MDKYYSPVVYGPIESRRLRHSLGINLLPLGRKVCSFDCLYCECGKYKRNLWQIDNQENFLKPKIVRQEIERCFQWHAEVKTQIDYITFAGNGEPMMYPWFEEAVESMLEMRDKYLIDTPTSVFTNATFTCDPKIIKNIYKLDRRFVKLDAGDQKTYSLINRPFVHSSFESIVEGLSNLRKIEISIAVVDGVESNIESLKSENFTRAIKKIRPLRLFIYAIDRPSACSGIVKVHQITLQAVGNFLSSQLNIPITVLESKKKRPSWFDESYKGLIDITPAVVFPIET